MTGVGMKKNTWTIGAGSLWVCCAVLLGCPADDVSGDADGSSTRGDDDDDDVDSNTSMNPPTTSGPGQTGDDTSTSGATTDETTTGENTGTTDGEDTETGSTTTGSMGICEVMLPPPGECMSEAPPGQGWRVAWYDGDFTVDGAFEPFDDDSFAIDDPDPELGGGFIATSTTTGVGESTDGGFIAFIDPTTGGPIQFECDTILQDCPEGEKCMPWANDGGGAWNATRCSPVAANPNQVGDNCNVEGSGVSGVDDCDIGAMCWDVDPETNIGTCIEMCSCSIDNPICQTPNTSCIIANQGSLTICLPVCNPVDIEACPDGEGCFPAPEGDLFHCAVSVGEGTTQGTECSFLNACDAGQACVNPDAIPNCNSGLGCCAEFCDTGFDECPAGTECVAWFPDGNEPDECLGQVGICGNPA